MSWQSLQRLAAQGALFFLPWTAANFGVAFTFGDAFLLAAILMNFQEWVIVRRFQIPFLIAFLFAVLSTLVDENVTRIRMLQTIYIWGLVVPFGWSAFTKVPVGRIAQLVITSCVWSALLAVAQGMGVVTPFENQQVFTLGATGFSRAAGFALQSNELAFYLSTMFALLVLLPRSSVRAICALCLLGGLGATLSKSSLFGVIPMCFWLHREGWKRSLVMLSVLVALMLTAAVVQSDLLVSSWHSFCNAAQSRVDNMDSSISARTSLMDEAVEMMEECSILGYGFEGSASRMIGNAGHNVHVYFLGLILGFGMPGMLCVVWGFGLLTWDTLRLKQSVLFVILLTFFVQLFTQTVMLLSAQNLPIMIAGAMLVRQKFSFGQNPLSRKWPDASGRLKFPSPKGNPLPSHAYKRPTKRKSA